MEAEDEADRKSVATIEGIQGKFAHSPAKRRHLGV
jgi:hypothetical protein